MPKEVNDDTPKMVDDVPYAPVPPHRSKRFNLVPISKHRGGGQMSLNTFRMGDYRCLKDIRGLVQAVVGPDTHSDALDCLNRLIEAAEQFEKMERQATLPTDAIPSD